MRIQILGTAAAEAWPGLFCGCEVCNKARASGGKDFRSRASIQIDDIYKIDLPPDTYLHTIRYGLDLSKLKYLFFTHSHGDHFSLQELEYLRPGFAHNQANIPVSAYGNPTVVKAISATKDSHPDLPMETRRAVPFEPIRADHLTFTPIIAEHAPGQEALNYIVQSGDSTVLYASDTGLYAKQTMNHLANYKFDVLIVECTQGTLDRPSVIHMGFDGVLELRDRLSRAGAVDANSRWVITHFSHNMGLLHAEMEDVAGREGIAVAYDGIVLEV